MTATKAKLMQIVQSESIIMVDVDETLIHHVRAPFDPSWKTIQVEDPYSKETVTLRVNEPMGRLVKEENSRGSTVIVWSRNGYRWAQAVLQALGLDNHVHQVMSKPRAYFDDKDCSDWLKDRVYLGPDTIYKK